MEKILFFSSELNVNKFFKNASSGSFTSHQYRERFIKFENLNQYEMTKYFQDYNFGITNNLTIEMPNHVNDWRAFDFLMNYNLRPGKSGEIFATCTLKYGDKTKVVKPGRALKSPLGSALFCYFVHPQNFAVDKKDWDNMTIQVTAEFQPGPDVPTEEDKNGFQIVKFEDVAADESDSDLSWSMGESFNESHDGRKSELKPIGSEIKSSKSDEEEASSSNVKKDADIQPSREELDKKEIQVKRFYDYRKKNEQTYYKGYEEILADDHKMSVDELVNTLKVIMTDNVDVTSNFIVLAAQNNYESVIPGINNSLINLISMKNFILMWKISKELKFSGLADGVVEYVLNLSKSKQKLVWSKTPKDLKDKMYEILTRKEYQLKAKNEE